MKRFVVIISILGVVLFATPGCKPKGSNESAGGSADSAEAVPESPIATEPPSGVGPNANVPASNLVPAPALAPTPTPTPTLDGVDVLGVFHFEEPGFSDNGIDHMNSYPISPKISAVVPGSHGTGVSFDRSTNNRYELFLKSKQISDTDIFKFEADLSLSGEYAHKQRLPVLSSAGGSEVQWDWGVIFLGESVHQYYRIYTEDGKVLEARSGALVEMNKQNRSSEVPLFTHISVMLKAASVVFFWH